jgi:hypothetical protein
VALFATTTPHRPTTTTHRASALGSFAEVPLDLGLDVFKLLELERARIAGRGLGARASLAVGTLRLSQRRSVVPAVVARDLPAPRHLVAHAVVAPQQIADTVGVASLPVQGTRHVSKFLWKFFLFFVCVVFGGIRNPARARNR